MRSGIVAGLIVSAMALAGCANGGDAGADKVPAPESEAATQQGPARSGPAKSLELPSKCDIVQEPQWRALGADQEPKEDESNGTLGCEYVLGEAGGDWGVFVATREQPLDELANVRSLSEPVEVAGYPGKQRGDDRNCITAFDVADGGSLWLNTVALDGVTNPCDLNEKFAAAALKNLLDAQ